MLDTTATQAEAVRQQRAAEHRVLVAYMQAVVDMQVVAAVGMKAAANTGKFDWIGQPMTSPGIAGGCFIWSENVGKRF